jgi:hypothetical protein
MNSQELRNLQEAYSQVYGLDEKFSDDTKRRATKHIKDTKKLLRSMGTEIDDKYNPEPEGYEPKSDKKIKKKTQKEQVDLYDIILSHLLDEGYADTQEQAEVIMVNMSEDWRESIMEGNENNKMTRLDKKDLRNKKFIANSPYGEIDPSTTDKRRVAAHDARRGVKTKKN